MYAAITIPYSGITNRLFCDVEVQGNLCAKSIIAMWDTGSTTSVISSAVAADMGLVPCAQTNFFTVSDSICQPQYRVDLVLSSNCIVTDLVVTGSPIMIPGIDMLIGMDVISLGDFSVSNFGGQTTFSFRIPSQYTTDYVAEIQTNT